MTEGRVSETGRHRVRPDMNHATDGPGQGAYLCRRHETRGVPVRAIALHELDDLRRGVHADHGDHPGGHRLQQLPRDGGDGEPAECLDLRDQGRAPERARPFGDLLGCPDHLHQDHELRVLDLQGELFRQVAELARGLRHLGHADAQPVHELRELLGGVAFEVREHLAGNLLDLLDRLAASCQASPTALSRSSSASGHAWPARISTSQSSHEGIEMLTAASRPGNGRKVSLCYRNCSRLRRWTPGSVPR